MVDDYKNLAAEDQKALLKAADEASVWLRCVSNSKIVIVVANRLDSANKDAPVEDLKLKMEELTSLTSSITSKFCKFKVLNFFSPPVATTSPFFFLTVLQTPRRIIRTKSYRWMSGSMYWTFSFVVGMQNL